MTTTAGAAAARDVEERATDLNRLHWRLPLLILVAIAVSNAASVPALSGLPVYLAALGLATAVLLFGVLTRRIELRLPVVAVLFLFLVGCSVPAVVAARDGQAAWAVLLQNIKDLWFLMVVLLLGSHAASAMSLARTMTAVMSILAGLTVANEFLLGNSMSFGGFSVLSTAQGVGTTIPRHQGPFEDPNFYGRVLVLVFPFALTLIAEAWGRRAHKATVAWSAGAAFLLGGVYLTGSRGAMVGLALTAVIWMVAAGPGPRRALVFVPAVLALAMLLPGVGSRMASLADLSPDTQSFAEPDGSIVERTASQKVMWAVFLANPLLGIGPDNVSSVWEEYATEGGGGIKREVAAHNLYLQAAAETGVLGLLGWLVFLFGVLVIAWRVVLSNPVSPRAPPTSDRLMAAAGVAALAGWMVTSIFLHLASLRLLLVVVAIVGIIAWRVPEAPARRDSAMTPLVPRRLVISVALLVMVLGALHVGYRAIQPTSAVAQVPVTLVATPDEGGQTDSYRRSVTQRRLIVGTYAAVFDGLGQPLVRDAENVKLSVVAPRILAGSSVDPTFLVRVEATDPKQAEQLALEVAERGRAYVGRTPSLSTFATTRVGELTSATASRWWQLL